MWSGSVLAHSTARRPQVGGSRSFEQSGAGGGAPVAGCAWRRCRERERHARSRRCRVRCGELRPRLSSSAPRTCGRAGLFSRGSASPSSSSAAASFCPRRRKRFSGRCCLAAAIVSRRFEGNPPAAGSRPRDGGCRRVRASFGAGLSRAAPTELAPLSPGGARDPRRDHRSRRAPAPRGPAKSIRVRRDAPAACGYRVDRGAGAAPTPRRQPPLPALRTVVISLSRTGSRLWRSTGRRELRMLAYSPSSRAG
jgi:hypothetical protein